MSHWATDLFYLRNKITLWITWYDISYKAQKRPAAVRKPETRQDRRGGERTSENLRRAEEKATILQFHLKNYAVLDLDSQRNNVKKLPVLKQDCFL